MNRMDEPGFSITQMPKILKNSVFAQKLSSKLPKNSVILKIDQKKLEKLGHSNGSIEMIMLVFVIF